MRIEVDVLDYTIDRVLSMECVDETTKIHLTPSDPIMNNTH